MRFDKYIPTESLKPYIKHYVVSENEVGSEYKVFPSGGLVIGFQYKGKLTTIVGNEPRNLNTAGITGITDSYKLFKNSANIGTILVYFTEIGFTHFASIPANEIFNLSLSLDDIFDKNKIIEVEEKLSNSITDKSRIEIIEQFLLSQLKEIQTDKLIIEAVKLIQKNNGIIQIKELNKQLYISQSPLEKRFRKVVGTSPKKFASIVRFNSILNNLKNSKSLIEISYENNYFDQSHFIKDFQKFTGETPEKFKRFL